MAGKWHLGEEPGHIPAARGFEKSLNYFKMTPGEGGIRSPMIILGPGVKGRRQADAFTYITDIMPTIMEMAKLKHPKK